MASFFGPALAMEAFSKAMGDTMGGVLAGEQRKGTIEAEEAKRAAMQREAQQQAMMMPLELAAKKQAMEAEKQRMALAGWEQVSDQYGNIKLKNKLTGEERPWLSGQTQQKIVGRNVYTLGPNGQIQAGEVPMTPTEQAAYNNIKHIQTIKDPKARAKFLEDWILTYPNLDKNSPAVVLAREMLKQQAAMTNKSYETTQTQETPRRLINDPMQRMYVQNSLIPQWLDRGADSTGRSLMDSWYPGFDDPKSNAVLDPATGRKITKRLALKLKLLENGYETDAQWNGKQFVIGPLYAPGEVTSKMTTRQPIIPSPGITLETE